MATLAMRERARPGCCTDVIKSFIAQNRETTRLLVLRRNVLLLSHRVGAPT